MRANMRLTIAAAAATILAQTSLAQTPSQDSPNDLIAIVGVHVIPMDSERLLEDQTVILRGDRIIQIGAVLDVPLPAGAIRIDGDGRFLMPGLMDLHTHLRRSDEYVNYLKYGVTTVMHMGGSGDRGSSILEERQRIESGDILGPNIYTTRQIFRGGEEDVRARVARLKRDGYDFVKIYNEVTYDQFTAIVDEARKQGLPVLGHIPRSFDPLVAMKGGQNAVVHTEEFFFTYFGGPRSTKNMDRAYRPKLSKIPKLARVLKKNNVAVMPDLAFTFTNFLMWDDIDNVWTNNEMAYQHPSTEADWRGGNINRRTEIENFIVRGQWKYNLMQELTREFEKAGILQVIGTDASVTGLFPGEAAHRELAELVKAGLSNYEALSIGTRNGGEFIRRYFDETVLIGQVAVGYRADLLLLDGNPLDDVRHARRVTAVTVNGRWTDVAEIDRERDLLRERYTALNIFYREVDEALAGAMPRVDINRLISRHDSQSEMIRAIEERINTAGYTLALAGNLGRALTILEIGTIAFPQSANAWDSLAEVTLMLGERDESIRLYRKALEVDPNFSNAKAQLHKILNDGK